MTSPAVLHTQLFDLRKDLEQAAILAEAIAESGSLSYRERHKLRKTATSLWAARDGMLPILSAAARRNPEFRSPR